MKIFITMIKGLVIGGTMLVPGVSGGSMAMILGIYQRLVHAVSSFRKDKKGNFLFLLLFSCGALLGMLLFARPLLHLIEQYPMPLLYFFIGAVAGGVPLILHQANVKKLDMNGIGYILIGLFLMLLLGLLPENLFGNTSQGGFVTVFLLLLAGFLAAVALVLPGISVSYLLLLLGLYDETMRAISELYLPFLLPLGIGLLLGILLTTRLLEQAMTNHAKCTYFIILGFIFASIIEVFPGIPSGMELIISIGMLLLGFACIWLLSIRERAQEK